MNAEEREAREATFLTEFNYRVDGVFEEVKIKWYDCNNRMGVSVSLNGWRDYCIDTNIGPDMTATSAALSLLRTTALRLKKLVPRNI